MNSLLPILSELEFPTNNKNTNVDTTTAVSQKPTISDEQPLPTLAPRCHMEPIKPKMNKPPTSTNTKTEPLSLELFNRPAADLDKKGEIEIEKYKKYLYNFD